MFQSFYDTENDRFIVSPLRCGSSYTHSLAQTLGMKHFDEIFYEVKEKGKHSTSDMKLITHNQSLKTLTVMTDEKYKDSKWVTIVRDPWARYLSAVNMILGSHYDAPSYVSPAEIKQDVDYNGVYVGNNHDSPYHYTDRAIATRNINGMGFDFAFQDNHCVPVLTIQLLMYVLNKNLEIVKLEDYTDWLKKHYPPGEVLQPDYYDIMGDSKRTNSDVPTGASVSLYKRFLEPLAWYDNKKARRFDIETTFSNFIQYDYDAWDLITSNLNRVSAQGLLEEMMEEPYFYARNKALYQVFIGGAKLSGLGEHDLFKQTLTMIPEIQQFVYKNSWLNLTAEAYQV